MSLSRRYVSSQDSRRHTCKDQTAQGKTLKLLGLPHTPVYICTYVTVVHVPLKPHVFWTSLYSNLACSYSSEFSHSKRSLLLSSWRTPLCSASSVFHPDHELHLFYLLTLFHILYSSLLKHPGIYPAMLLLDISFHLSILSSPAWTHDPHLNPALVPLWISSTFFRQNPNLPLCLHLLLLLTKLFWPYYQKHKTSFRKITTKLCSLVLIDSHAVMISGLHWVFHTTCPEPVSLIHSHPLPAFILLYKVLPLNLFLPSQDDHISFAGAFEIKWDHLSSVFCPFHQDVGSALAHYLPRLLSFHGNSIPPFLKILVYF